MMKSMIENNGDENIRILGEATRQSVDLPVARPACCHGLWGSHEPGSGRIPFYLELNYRTKPQRIKDVLCKLLGAARRLALYRC